MQLINAVEVCHGMFKIENEVCCTYGSFTEALKAIPLLYGLWGIIIYGAF